jgi:hypothetical protein
MMRIRSFQIPTTARAVAVVLLLHLVALLAMAASPSLHKAFHHHADESDHVCAVTMFTQGGADAPLSVTLVIAVTPVLLVVLSPRPVWVEKLFLVLRVLEHAPPTV